ncbi:hypothetical protein X474_22885 [Dethiosulfatarculus sandiegensis]|uniref:Uncharacterized protein n=1 Tax=Dethiosulfatarculus sandiegensis TaxID=1429043 RepID=A0A0D2J0K1_9BACT|nr:hypothetical protein X474_22885 [Dethiosulfatarculus sandiegensis]
MPREAHLAQAIRYRGYIKKIAFNFLGEQIFYLLTG